MHASSRSIEYLIGPGQSHTVNDVRKGFLFLDQDQSRCLSQGHCSRPRGTVTACAQGQAGKSVLCRATRPVEAKREAFLHFSRHDCSCPKCEPASNLRAAYPARSYSFPFRDAPVLCRDSLRLRRRDEREGQFCHCRHKHNKLKQFGIGGRAQRQSGISEFWKCVGRLKLQSKPYDYKFRRHSRYDFSSQRVRRRFQPQRRRSSGNPKSWE